MKLPASQHRLTDKASDFESEDCGFESLRGRLCNIKSCAVFERFFLEKPLKSCLKNRSFLAVIFERFFKQDLSGFLAVFERSSRVEVPDSPRPNLPPVPLQRTPPPPPPTTYPLNVSNIQQTPPKPM